MHDRLLHLVVAMIGDATAGVAMLKSATGGGEGVSAREGGDASSDPVKKALPACKEL